MERRKFLGLGLVAVTLAPATLSAIDFRATKPAAWSATTVADAIKALYGDITPTQSGIKLTVPKKAANPGAVPVKIKSKIAMKSLSILQDANSGAAVATYTLLLIFRLKLRWVRLVLLLLLLKVKMVSFTLLLKK